MNASVSDTPSAAGNPAESVTPTRVLLVDDERVVLKALNELLTLADFEVTPVSSAELAIAKLETDVFDLVVSDYRLGGKQGDAVVLAARATYPATPVMVITGLVDELPVWMRKGVASVPIVPKPFRMHELIGVMKHTMEAAADPTMATVA